MQLFRRTVILALSLLALGLAQGAYAQGAQYYMVMFGYQSSPNMARSSHTFATFVEVQNGAVDHEVTISWLPAPGYFGPGNTMPPLSIVPGHNYTLDETIALGGPGAQIEYWGPYQITPDLFQRAVARDEFLNEGTTSYKMFVLRQSLRMPALYNQPGGVINCIMGVSDIGGFQETGSSWGYDASSQVLQSLARWAYDYPYGTHADVAELMHLRERLGR